MTLKWVVDGEKTPRRAAGEIDPPRPWRVGSFRTRTTWRKRIIIITFLIGLSLGVRFARGRHARGKLQHPPLHVTLVTVYNKDIIRI